MRAPSKKALAIVLSTALAVALLPALVLAWSFSGLNAVPETQDLGEGVSIVRDGFVAVGLIELGAGEIALVDCGMSADAAPVVAALAKRGLGPEAVRAILLTHGHGDHTGGCGAFPEAEIFALAEADPEIGFPFTRVPGGERFDVGERTAAIYPLPGHTHGSAAYLVNGVLFLGDTADIGTDGAIHAAKWIFTDDPPRSRESLAALADRLDAEDAEVRWIVTGHSGCQQGLEGLRTFSP